MNLGLVAGLSVGAVAVGLVLAGVVEHLAWRAGVERRRRRRERCGRLDLSREVRRG